MTPYEKCSNNPLLDLIKNRPYWFVEFYTCHLLFEGKDNCEVGKGSTVVTNGKLQIRIHV